MDSFLKQYCSPEWQKFVNFHTQEFLFKAKDLIFKEGDKTLGLYIVTSGKVKVITKNEAGSRLVRLAGDGDILGHRGFGGDWTYPISAIALENTSVKFIPIEIFNQVARSNSEFTYQLMMFFAEELRLTEEKLTQLPVKNRVAKAIYFTYKAFGFKEDEPGLLAFTLSRKDMASKAGTTYETVIRVLSDLNNQQIINLENKEIRIVDFDQLVELSRPLKPLEK